MRENPDRGPIFDTCDNLADSARLHRPGLLFAARDVMEYRTEACLAYCTLMFAAPVEASRPSMAASPRERTNAPTSWAVRFVPKADIALTSKPTGRLESQLCAPPPGSLPRISDPRAMET